MFISSILLPYLNHCLNKNVTADLVCNKKKNNIRFHFNQIYNVAININRSQTLIGHKIHPCPMRLEQVSILMFAIINRRI